MGRNILPATPILLTRGISLLAPPIRWAIRPQLLILLAGNGERPRQRITFYSKMSTTTVGKPLCSNMSKSLLHKVRRESRRYSAKGVTKRYPLLSRFCYAFVISLYNLFSFSIYLVYLPPTLYLWPSETVGQLILSQLVGNAALLPSIYCKLSCFDVFQLLPRT